MVSMQNINPSSIKMFDAQLMKTFTDVKTGTCELSEHCMCNVSCASNHADTR